jgi:hypothetical protein
MPSHYAHAPCAHIFTTCMLSISVVKVKIFENLCLNNNNKLFISRARYMNILGGYIGKNNYNNSNMMPEGIGLLLGRKEDNSGM